MPSYYDEKQKTYYCKFYYKDWTGQRRQKLKRGFTKKGDAIGRGTFCQNMLGVQI